MHKYYKDQPNKGTLPVINKPDQVFPEEEKEEQDRLKLIKEFMAMGYKKELVANCSRDALTKIMEKLKSTRQEREEMRKKKELDKRKRDEEVEKLKQLGN
ncbi:hypothetical protein L1987_01711 [Smallanthus sonchifolius]|uniref:Uncharacterized protein n=1 Tax=Smallanthus sonchifolius TaxID=185202 RepID=A0ACB9K5S8_9ASTR|nr:hypothetical protein L1987_01711 [Smallanthus sonchifolius]